MAFVIAEQARLYNREFGWNVVPVRAGKRPSGVWKQYQQQRLHERLVAKLFERPASGLAVITGWVSGGLAVRDFDEREAYRRWAAAFPKLADELPTAITARGYHVYFRMRSQLYLGDLGDGELRGDNLHVVILAPSPHPARVIYRWAIPPVPGWNSNLLLLDPHKTGLAKSWMESGDESGQGASQKKEHTVIHDSMFQGPDDVIARTLPAREGQRNWCLFQYARHLKGNPAYAGSEPEDLRPLVLKWFERALPTIRTKDFTVTWSDFVRGWQAIHSPVVGGAQDVALGQALRDEPEVARRYKDPRLRLLAGICWHLARYNAGEPFFISSRDAARLLGLEGANAHRDAWRLLRHLEQTGLLVVVQRGTPGVVVGGKATFYRLRE